MYVCWLNCWVVCCLSFVVCLCLVVDRYSSSVLRRWLFVVCGCLLFVGWCLLDVVRSSLLVVG